MGLSVSGINMAYDNAGTIGNEDATLQITLSADHGDTAGYVKQLREELPRRFPGWSSISCPPTWSARS
jgi:hypothetical protein